jgi:uncharacterized membrane protein YdbT with pleckstrin-like domain
VKRFKSKIDAWILVLLIVVLVVQAYVFFTVLFGVAPLSAKTTMTATTLLVFFLVGSVLIRTHYTIADGSLKIVCGPVWRTVPIDSIRSVRSTRNPLSSPALSLDRLRIEYGGGRSVMISPDDKDKFMKALGRDLDD